MKIEFKIDGKCEFCKEGLKYLKEAKKRHLGYFSDVDTKNNKRIPALVLQPAYDSSGRLFDWHIKKEKGE